MIDDSSHFEHGLQLINIRTAFPQICKMCGRIKALPFSSQTVISYQISALNCSSSTASSSIEPYLCPIVLSTRANALPFSNFEYYNATTWTSSVGWLPLWMYRPEFRACPRARCTLFYCRARCFCWWRSRLALSLNQANWLSLRLTFLKERSSIHLILCFVQP